MSREIEQGTWDTFEPAGYPEDITTGGLGPCTGIIIFDKSSRITVGGHFPTPHSHEAENFEDMLSSAARRFSDSPLVHIYLSGCCHDQDLEDYDPRAIRLYVERQVSKSFPEGAQIHACWPKPGIGAVTMTLDPDTGEMFID